LTIKLMVMIVVCTGLATSDSLELQNGRHLQGRYVGGTATMIGFVTGTAIQYFATSDVLALIFDNVDSPVSGASPAPMKGVPRGNALRARIRLARKEPRMSRDKTGPELERISMRSNSASD